MELREVRSFVTLAEQLHFGRAARLLNLSQPALTKQIRRLEEEVGGALLIRGQHGTQLTALGREFLRGARASVRDFDELLERTRRTALGEAGRLRIGFGFHTFELVPRIVVRLRKSIPSIEISLRRGRMIDVHDQQLTEQLAFKGTMSAFGCGLLLVIVPALLVLGWIAGMVGIPVAEYWPHVLLAILALFLGLQFLPKLLYKPPPIDGESR